MYFIVEKRIIERTVQTLVNIKLEIFSPIIYRLEERKKNRNVQKNVLRGK